MRAISEGWGAPMRSKVTPARLAMKGMRPSFLRSTSVTDTPVLPARPVRPLLWIYVSGSCTPSTPHISSSNAPEDMRTAVSPARAPT